MRKGTRGFSRAPARRTERIPAKRGPAVIILRAIGIRPPNDKAISFHWGGSKPIRSKKARSTVIPHSPFWRDIHTFSVAAIRVTITRKTVDVLIYEVASCLTKSLTGQND